MCAILPALSGFFLILGLSLTQVSCVQLKQASSISYQEYELCSFNGAVVEALIFKELRASIKHPYSIQISPNAKVLYVNPWCSPEVYCIRSDGIDVLSLSDKTKYKFGNDGEILLEYPDHGPRKFTHQPILSGEIKELFWSRNSNYYTVSYKSGDRADLFNGDLSGESILQVEDLSEVFGRPDGLLIKNSLWKDNPKYPKFSGSKHVSYGMRIENYEFSESGDLIQTSSKDIDYPVGQELDMYVYACDIDPSGNHLIFKKFYMGKGFFRNDQLYDLDLTNNSWSKLSLPSKHYVLYLDKDLAARLFGK